jgi:hypothetical protein
MTALAGLGIDLSLILCPLRPPSRDVETILFAGEHGFFEAQPLGMDKIPQRPIIDLEAALGSSATSLRGVNSF